MICDNKMAAIHSKSKDVELPQLQLFDVPNTQYDVEGVRYEFIYPKNSIGGEDVPMEFEMTGTGEEFCDMAFAQILIGGKLVRIDGKPIDSMIVPVPTETDAPKGGKDNVGMTNSSLHASFLSVTAKYNGVQTGPHSPDHAYIQHIQDTLGYGSDAKGTHMQNRFYFVDTPGYMDDITGLNEGLQARKKFTDNSQDFEMMGPLGVDVAGTNRFLINNVKVEVKIVRRASAFCLMADKDDYRLEITKAILIVKKIRLSVDALTKIYAKLSAGETAKYPYKRHEVKTFKIGHDETVKVVDHLFNGIQPNLVVIGFVEEVAYHGKIDKNPFNFQNLDITSLSVTSAGQQFPATPLKPDFRNKGVNKLAYNTIASGTGIHHGDEGNCIDYKTFHDGTTLIVLDLTQDQSASQGTHWNGKRMGNFRLEMTLRQPTNKPIVGIVYAEFDALMQIDNNRNITLTSS